jgi:hypothetical protein
MELALMKVGGSAAFRPESVYRLLNSFDFDENTSAGFRELDVNGGRVEGFAVKRSAVFVKIFDTVSRQLVDHEEFIIREVFFRLDVKRRMIEVYSTPRGVQSLVTTFSQTVGDSYFLSQLTIKIPQLLRDFRTASPVTTINRLLISDYVGEKGAVGNYDIRSIDAVVAWRLLDAYPKGIKHVAISTELSGTTVPIQVFQNGKVRIASRRDETIQEVLNRIKDTVGSDKET